MTQVNRVLIQSRTLNLTKDEDTGNFYGILDVPEEASLVVHEYFEYDEDHAVVKVSVAEIVDTYTDETETPEVDEADPEVLN